MASAVAAVFGHDELVRTIALELPRTPIATLRLTSQYFKLRFSPCLFRILRLRFSMWYFKRLVWVAAHPVLSRGVEELIFDTATYIGIKDLIHELLMQGDPRLARVADKDFEAAGLLFPDPDVHSTLRDIIWAW
ncbi:hypothetical protein LTR95_016014 [Oleoguttula sp. CCFEE 5521]